MYDRVCTVCVCFVCVRETRIGIGCERTFSKIPLRSQYRNTEFMDTYMNVCTTDTATRKNSRSLLSSLPNCSIQRLDRNAVECVCMCLCGLLMKVCNLFEANRMNMCAYSTPHTIKHSYCPTTLKIIIVKTSNTHISRVRFMNQPTQSESDLENVEFAS